MNKSTSSKHNYATFSRLVSQKSGIKFVFFFFRTQQMSKCVG
ncbi:hypothetical protein HanXRQr2_Chr17g0822661 [Helianthus annuus]|uniref:Uncharacterized protein n=1 Tax=Helianthus annuus TaxID=4232 RepID=A0A9K3DN07_HELAN|nr:hypothetical protein HanXRQr2_Chr17g0822661 [Helianthus annuus]KAJ0448958.1 hypothetical protein HanHA89_Chr17g0722951 [Helianthus annuus]KAJ0637630.1 hypothetical protein HanOQP8_Chr17g0676111 [Helianthus annuus]KAJ0814815.1 hypothetical protein HanPSC8_Chr17g0790261 [Helianthus annuus]